MQVSSRHYAIIRTIGSKWLYILLTDFFSFNKRKSFFNCLYFALFSTVSLHLSYYFYLAFLQ